MNTIVVSHDPFARQSLVRQTIKTNETCAWCGQNHKNKLFIYGNEDDDKYRISWQNQKFCSVSCMRSFYD